MKHESKYWRLGKPLTSFENLELIQRCRLGSPAEAAHAREAIVRGNQGVIKPWVIRFASRRIDECDLRQEGNIGLLRAIDSFDPIRNRAFATYAGRAVRNHLLNWIEEHGRTIRVSTYSTRKEGRSSTACRSDGERAKSCVSIDAETSSGSPLGRLVVDNASLSADYWRKGYRDTAIHAAIAMLPERQQAAVRLRYGFSDGCEWEIREIAEASRVSYMTTHKDLRAASSQLRRRLARLIA